MKKVSLLLFIVLFLVVGCGKKQEVRPSPEAEKAREAFKIAENLRQAYISRDKTRFEGLTTKNGYLKILSSLRGFDSVTLEFTPRWVEMEDNSIILYIHWKGTWQKSGREFKDEGLAAFVLKDNPMLLDDILRDNPFSRPEM